MPGIFYYLRMGVDIGRSFFMSLKSPTSRMSVFFHPPSSIFVIGTNPGTPGTRRLLGPASCFHRGPPSP